MPDDPLNALRVLLMLVFIAAFLGVVASQLRPSAKRRGREASMIPMRDDAIPGEPTPGGQQ